MADTDTEKIMHTDRANHITIDSPLLKSASPFFKEESRSFQHATNNEYRLPLTSHAHDKAIWNVNMLKLRPAQPKDASLITEYIRELAEFEQLADECHATPELLRTWLFGETPRAYCLLAEWKDEPAGFALYFYNFSTFLTKPGIYIEDVFIRPNFRRNGIARSIFQHLAQKALDEGCGRLEWWVLNWNTDAITFYQSIGAIPMDEWTVQRVTGHALERLAAGK